MPRRAADTRLSLVVAAAVAVTVGTVPAVPPTTAADDDVIGNRLEKALDGQAPYDGEPYVTDGTVTVLLAGPNPPTPADPPTTREGWVAHFDAHHQPFESYATRLLHDYGVEVDRSVAPANSIFAEVPIDRVDAIVEADRERRAMLSTAALDWHGAVELHNTESVPPTEVQAFHDHGMGGEGVTIAGIDSGVDANHTCLRDADDEPRLVGWKDFTSNSTRPYDDNGHGTHTMATAAGSRASTGCQEPGMAPEADIMAAKAFGMFGYGSFEDTQAALEWAFENGADVATNSWGGACSDAGIETRDLVNDLAEAGFEQAFAAGNDGPYDGSIACPATARHAVTVGATDKDLDVASFSSRGPCDDGTGERVCPDVMAVGTGVRSAVPGGYTHKSGTSMATPHVAGAIAVVEGALQGWAQRGLLAPGADEAWAPVHSEAEHLLEGCAEDLGEAGPDNATGWGFLRMGCILDAVRERSRPVVEASASVGDPHLECEEATEVVLDLVNVGGQPAAGHARLSVEGPQDRAFDGPVTVPFDGAKRVMVPVDASMAAGDYQMQASYTYAWEDPRTGEPASETRETSTAFQVHKAVVEPLRPLASPVLPGTVFNAGPTVVNAGNAPATGLTVLETVPSAYDVAPRVPGEDPGTLWSDPAPDRKVTRLDGTTYMDYNVGDLEPGAAWTLDYRLLAEKTGQHELTSDVAFSDHGACEGASTLARAHTVALTG